MWVSDRLLLDYQRCDRRAFLDLWGDANHRDPPSDYLRKLYADGQHHRQQVLAAHTYTTPSYPEQAWQAGAAATAALMAQGVPTIYQPVLLQEDSGFSLLSQPDLLVKYPGPSRWGEWSYRPVSIRLGKRPKLDYQIVAAFQAYLLAQVQDALPDVALLMLREKGTYEVNLEVRLPQLQEILQACLAMLRSRQEPEVFISRNRCELCHWFSHCYALAQSQQHLSLLPGVTPNRYSHLQLAGITSLEALAQINPLQLARRTGFDPAIAVKLVRQAQATLYQQPILITDELQANRSPHRGEVYTTTDWGTAAPFLGSGGTDTLPLALTLPAAPVEFYFDVEAEPDLNLTYLHGLLVVDRVNRTETFYSLLAEQLGTEEQVWRRFLALVDRYPDAPIFHFCPFEVQVVQQLAQAYATPPALLQRLLPRFVDIHAWVTRTVTLPIENYALKSIARWLGFDWRDAEANGAQSVCWYNQWLQTGERRYLEAIQRYNEDDCRATYHVKQWLAEFIAHRSDRQLTTG